LSIERNCYPGYDSTVVQLTIIPRQLLHIKLFFKRYIKVLLFVLVTVKIVVFPVSRKLTIIMGMMKNIILILYGFAYPVIV
jgi:hypothetical protein